MPGTDSAEDNPTHMRESGRDRQKKMDMSDYKNNAAEVC